MNGAAILAAPGATMSNRRASQVRERNYESFNPPREGGRVRRPGRLCGRPSHCALTIARYGGIARAMHLVVRAGLLLLFLCYSVSFLWHCLSAVVPPSSATKSRHGITRRLTAARDWQHGVYGPAALSRR